VHFTVLGNRESEATTNVTVAPSGLTLVGNPSFDYGLWGWSGSAGVSLDFSSQPRSGSHALAVQGPDTLAEFGINDSPNWVATTVNPGTHYRFACWVRADAPGGVARIMVREYQKKIRLTTTMSSNVALAESWRKVVVDAVASGAANTLDMQILCSPNARHARFYVDDVSIRVLDAPLRARAVGAVGDTTARLTTSAALFPNPMRDHGTLALAIARSGPLRLAIYDLRGRRVRTVCDRADAAAGRYQFELGRDGVRAERLTPGMYFYRFESAEGVRLGRFVILN